jgi:hypothetical protein
MGIDILEICLASGKKIPKNKNKNLKKFSIKSQDSELLSHSKDFPSQLPLTKSTGEPEFLGPLAET